MAASHRLRIGIAAFTTVMVAEGIGYLMCWRTSPPPHISSSTHVVAALLGVLVSSMLLAVFLNRTVAVTVERWVEALCDQMKTFAAGGFKEWPTSAEDRGSQPLPEFHTLTLVAEQMAATLKTSEAQLRAEERQHLEWLAYLAHDLGTPVERIIARLQAMELIAEGDPQRMKQLLSEAKRGVRQLSELICSISQLADLESNIERNFTMIPLDDMLTKLIDTFEFEAFSKDVELDLRIVPGIGPVRIETYLFKRCVENLMTNALRHTPYSGLISIRAERVEDFVQIRVSDTGPGIPVEIMPNIFDFGFRGPGQRPARAGAHGLGLAFVKCAAEIHQGTVDVRNLEDSGAEFRLMLPLPPSAGGHALSV